MDDADHATEPGADKVNPGSPESASALRRSSRKQFARSALFSLGSRLPSNAPIPDVPNTLSLRRLCRCSRVGEVCLEDKAAETVLRT